MAYVKRTELQGLYTKCCGDDEGNHQILSDKSTCETGLSFPDSKECKQSELLEHGSEKNGYVRISVTGDADGWLTAQNGLCRKVSLDIPEQPEQDVSESDAIIKDGGGRGTWANKVEFFLAIMGYTVGIGSVWRFPIICSRNGGGAFLIPFFFFLLAAGGPLYYMEMCLGQFTGKSAGQAFECCPLLKGLGVLQVTLSLTVLWYSMCVLSWTFYFLFYSFFPVLPWTTCGNLWNTDSCISITELWSHGTENVTYLNTSMTSYNMASSKAETEFSSSAYEFWEFNVIGRSNGLEEMGSIQLHLVICLFLAWLFTVLAVIKGVQTLGKVVYVTATAPYIFLTIMFIKALTLDGAMDGIKKYVTPDFSKLLTTQVWLDAALQVFYSLGPSWGGVITMASYSKFHRKNFRSSALCVASAGFTSFYNGLVVFALLGFMAKQSNSTVQQVASQSGPGLAFVAFPTVLSHMPVPQLWCVLFFLTLVTIVFDSLFGMFETITSYFIDTFPEKLVPRRVLVNLITGALFFMTGIPLTMNGGIYIFQLADWYFAAFALLACSFLECVAIFWIYGTDRFATDIRLMTGRHVSIVLRILWTTFIPIAVFIVFAIMLSRYSSPKYGDGYIYSDGAVAVGVFFGLLPIVIMVAVGIRTIYQMKGTLVERFKNSLQPSCLWAPNDPLVRERYEANPYMYPNNLWKRMTLDILGTK